MYSGGKILFEARVADFEGGAGGIAGAVVGGDARGEDEGEEVRVGVHRGDYFEECRGGVGEGAAGAERLGGGRWGEEGSVVVEVGRLDGSWESEEDGRGAPHFGWLERKGRKSRVGSSGRLRRRRHGRGVR